MQVADRFHLVANLREATRQVLERNRGCLPTITDETERAPQAEELPPADWDCELLGGYGWMSEREAREREASRVR